MEDLPFQYIHEKMLEPFSYTTLSGRLLRLFQKLPLITFQPPGPTTYYVNDNSTSGDTWCSAVGNDGNNGTSASTPKATLAAALALAGSNDIIVDKGTYTDDKLDLTSSNDGFR